MNKERGLLGNRQSSVPWIIEVSLSMLYERNRYGCKKYKFSLLETYRIKYLEYACFWKKI